MEIDDKILIKKLKSNNQQDIDEGFEGIYQKYSKLLYVCIHKYVASKESVEDLLSDTFLKVYENRYNLKADKNFKYYLVTTAKNLAINFIKKKDNEVDVLDIDVIDENIYEDSNLRDMIDILKRSLDHEEVDIVINHLVYDYTFEEIGYKLGLSTNTIKTKYFRALKKVKQ